MQISNSPMAKGQNSAANLAKQQKTQNATKNQKSSNDIIIKGEVKAKQRKATEIVVRMEAEAPKDKNKKSQLEPVIKGEIKPGDNREEEEKSKGTLEKWMEKHPSRFERAKEGPGRMTHKPY